MRIAIVALVVVSLSLVPDFAAAQSICYACHGAHGNIWRGQKVFHGGGVGHCSMCHTMHNSEDGDPVPGNAVGGTRYLLRGNATDVCLTCHGGTYGNVFGNDPEHPPYGTAAGNFAFLLEDNLNDGYGGAANPIAGDAAGHNVVSPDRGTGPDRAHAVAPGGTFPADKLGCTSCHDPHGNRNYRMLYGVGQVQDGLYTFVNPAPEAQGLSIYHGSESPSRHTAYRAGMSEWCANCHGEFAHPGLTHRHPSGVPLGTDIAATYNAYAGSDNPLGGTAATAYLPQVPFEDPSAATRSAAGPAASSRVMCLSCHRAHGSSAPDAMRWDPNVTFLAEDGLVSGSYALPSPYAHPAQRSLCNKCHRKDEMDSLAGP